MQSQTQSPTSPLTPRQMQLLGAIASFRASRCYSPTIGELADELTISRSTTFEHIGELLKKELVLTSPGKARSLKLTLKARKLLSQFADNNPDEADEESGGIRLAGRVAAGLPIEAIEDRELLSLNSHFGADENTFALEVKGDSMIGDGIYDGDHVICRKSSVAGNGQLVIAIVDNENATLKRFYKEKTCVRLQPANDAYEPIYSENCRIEAVVVGLVRKIKN
jgi:repressor LexA